MEIHFCHLIGHPSIVDVDHSASLFSSNHASDMVTERDSEVGLLYCSTAAFRSQTCPCHVYTSRAYSPGVPFPTPIRSSSQLAGT